jgi:hypothetical protein
MKTDNLIQTAFLVCALYASLATPQAQPNYTQEL